MKHPGWPRAFGHSFLAFAVAFALLPLLPSWNHPGGPQVAPAWADGMRCGTRLVSDGDNAYQVRSLCGDPDAVTSWVEYRSVKVRVGNAWIDRVVEVKHEEWTYDQGSSRLVRFLFFENGRLREVRTGPYGEKH